MFIECEEQIPEMLRLFRDNCLNLRQIYCSFYENTAQLYQQFGPLVTRIDCDEFPHVFDTTSGQLLAKNMHTFELDIYSSDNKEQLSAFVAHNQSLKYMTQQMKHKKTSLVTTDNGNKRQAQMYAKNSMDRFGDDMYGLMLSYFSIEDRFQCECVSKQFQRTVFRSVVDITLNDRIIKRLRKEKTINLQLLATIAIKCPNIQTIDCRGIDTEFEEHIPEMLNTFRDNCRHLREIYRNLYPMNRQPMAALGPLVTRIGHLFSTETRALTHCHRLSHLGMSYLQHAFDFNQSDQLIVKNVRQLELKFYEESDGHRLATIVAGIQCLQSVKVMCYCVSTHQSLPEMCGQLSRLTQLRRLSLGLLIASPHISVHDSLRTIGVNCKQLKRLSLKLSGVHVWQALIQSVDWLRFYSRLKWLRLEVYAAIDDQLLEPLKHCKSLTHLELYIREMTANVLKDLHLNCPRIQYLFVCEFYNIIDNEYLSHISRLPALQMLVIQCRQDINLSDNDMNAVLSSSPKLKTIEIRVNNEKKFYSK
ncbi:unnamed protein product [Medioppia subpectinata]|uniref:F-box domain-containing protein n=1 Tax=Medioppia subpectinata TaxID=1979941 RepID=A0A7R9PWM6_9ACAR|nr:unnamed protein product [Medioppia subpectinata]CAG2103936.1 unnamed protein product [Medioppia subpectinata]